jgi:hypothetical protein
MGFWSRLFGKKKKPARPAVDRHSKAVARLAQKRGCSIYALDLEDAGLLEELLFFGLMLSEDGDFYYDDPHWVEEPLMDESVENTMEPGLEIELLGEEELLVQKELPAEEPLPVVEQEPVVEVPPAYEPPPAPPAPVYEPPVPSPEPERSSWTSEPSESSWGGSSDSGGGGGGFDD